MKKLLLSCALALTAAVTFTSCDAETCYECSLAATSTCTVDVCGGRATGSSTVCNTAATAANVLNNTNEDVKKYLETVGYTCTKK